MKRFVLIFLFVSLFSNLFGIDNKLDSLQRAISSMPADSNKVKTMLGFMNLTQHVSKDNAIFWGKQALLLSNKLNWTYGSAVANERIGRIYWSIGKYDSALFHHYHSLKQFRQLNNWKDYWDVVVMIGQDFANSSKYSSAIIYFNAALAEYKVKKVEGGVTYVLSMLAWVYGNKGDYVKASQLIFEKIKIDEKNKDSITALSGFFDLASNYLHLNKYDEADSILRNWYPFIQRVNSPRTLMDFYIFKAQLFLYRNQTDSALLFYEKEKLVGMELNDNYWVGDAFSAIGNLYIQKKEWNKALKNLDSSYYYYNLNQQYKELASVNCKKTICLVYDGKKNEAKPIIEEAARFIKNFTSNSSNLEYYQAKYLYDSACQNWQSAYVYIHLYHDLLSRIYSQSNTQQMLEMNIRHEAHQREDLLREKNTTIIWYLIILAILTISLALLYILSSLKNKKIKRHNDIQRTMLHEIHHRVKNNLQLISSFMQLQLHKTTDAKGRDALEESINNIYVVALVHDNLYNQSTDLVSLKSYIPKLCADINSLVKTMAQPQINIHCDDILMSIDQTIPIGLILNELLTNSVKYAFIESRKNENKINISITKMNKSIIFHYSDNGIGFNVNEKSKTSLGLKLVKMLVQELQGNYTMDGNQGFEFDLKFNTGK